MTYCQFNEEELLDKALASVSIEIGTACEIGCLPDYKFSNIKHLEDKGWKAHYISVDEFKGYIINKVTPENVNDILSTLGTIDLLSIDIDGNDYYVFKALESRPKIVIIEYNRTMEDGGMEKDNDYVWKSGWAFGTSEKKMVELAKRKGYRFFSKNESNLIFIWEKQ